MSARRAGGRRSSSLVLLAVRPDQRVTEEHVEHSERAEIETSELYGVQTVPAADHADLASRADGAYYLNQCVGGSTVWTAQV